jgi:putative endonuclease
MSSKKKGLPPEARVGWDSREIGKRGEEHVAIWIRQQGFIILATNYRQRFGEIDIIAESRAYLIFVEVKYRANNLMPAAELVPLSKQKKIIRVAQAFLTTHPHEEKIIRFDVALLHGDQYDITYIPHAFV